MYQVVSGSSMSVHILESELDAECKCLATFEVREGDIIGVCFETKVYTPCRCNDCTYLSQ